MKPKQSNTHCLKHCCIWSLCSLKYCIKVVASVLFSTTCFGWWNDKHSVTWKKCRFVVKCWCKPNILLCCTVNLSSEECVYMLASVLLDAKATQIQHKVGTQCWKHETDDWNMHAECFDSGCHELSDPGRFVKLKCHAIQLVLHISGGGTCLWLTTWKRM